MLVLVQAGLRVCDPAQPHGAAAAFRRRAPRARQRVVAGAADGAWDATYGGSVKTMHGSRNKMHVLFLRTTIRVLFVSTFWIIKKRDPPAPLYVAS